MGSIEPDGIQRGSIRAQRSTRATATHNNSGSSWRLRSAAQDGDGADSLAKGKREDGTPILLGPGLENAPRPTLATLNLQAAVGLLQALRGLGLGQLVLCPGSRSSPLAVAAGLLEPAGLDLITAIDERSAAFFALGCSRASGKPAAVVTTSGTAVANLLPAAVEADFGTIPLLLITADRPARLKGCGANQTVNQETFLVDSVRWLGQTPAAGLAAMAPADLGAMARQAMDAAVGDGRQPAGPVHLNLAIEEPLHVEAPALAELAQALRAPRSDSPWLPRAPVAPLAAAGFWAPALGLAGFDPDRPGVVVAGPWRGNPQHWDPFVAALRRWLERSGWPLLSDGLSGLRGVPGLEQVHGYDLLLDDPPQSLACQQVLRLGPLPASRRLQRWLEACGGNQVLVSEGDPRGLDPLAVCSQQTAIGLAAWVGGLPSAIWPQPTAEACRVYAGVWHQRERELQAQLDQALAGACSEPALARQLSRLLPEGVPVVMANSSPVRDWESFGDPEGKARSVLGFRGASGIDGTLSLACGVAQSLGQAVLITGDLALLHDSNGWLWQPQLAGRLTVVLINNAGGGIFEQLPIRLEGDSPLDFERLFAMPQPVEALALAAAYGVPARRLEAWSGLAADLAWALQQPMALLEVRTDRQNDARQRHALRRMAHALNPLP